MQARHAYFENKPHSFLRCSPSQATIALLARHAFILRQVQNGVQLYAETEASYDAYFDERAPLDFNIASTDPNFFNYTKLPTDFQGLLVYASEDELNQSNNESVTLHPRFVDQPDALKLGTLQIASASIKASFDTNSPGQFEIRFETRHTLWQYHIFGHGISQLNIRSIDGAADIPFSKAVETTLANGQNAWQLTSEFAIPLGIIKPKFQLTYTDIATTTKTVVLPNADPAKLAMTEINGEKRIVSPLYVYV